MMNLYLMLADIVAIAILVIAFYVPRKGRRELVSSFLVTNIGVLAVATAMSIGTVAAGLGLGLFGVLSIIRLRSEELSHREIAYYFAALSLGLLGGLNGPLLWSIGLMALVLVAIAVGDHPRVTARSKSTELIIDEAITDPDALQLRASQILGATVTNISVRRIDLINDSTIVQVHFRTAAQDSNQRGIARRLIGQSGQSDQLNAEQRGTYQGPFEPAMRTVSSSEGRR